jgi:uncharacterized oligopeptide transporter (OPT) family protein
MQKATSLFLMAVLGGLLKIWSKLAALIESFQKLFHLPATWGEAVSKWTLPETFPLFPGVTGQEWLKSLTIGFEGSTILIAAGAIMGIRVGVSLLIGAVAYYGILAPLLIEHEIIQSGGYKEIVSWILWPSTAMMVASGLLAFGLRWRTIFRAFGELTAIFGKKNTRKDPLAHIEVPASWFLLGIGISGTACVILGHWRFEISWWMGILAVLLTFMLAIVAARATGETDVTPVGPMGKITQLAYGAIAPSNMTTKLMTASITAGAACHSADLLTDLKSGYLLGSNPRKQTIAQFFGVLAGVLLCVPVYTIIVKTPTPQTNTKADAAPVETNLGTKSLPAPSATVWAAVAQVLNKGIGGLPKGTVWAMLIGAILGVGITLCEEFLPKRYAKWIPSATGLGIAGVVPAFNSISMFLGALVAWIWSKAHAESAEKYVISGSSGLIAGESLMGVAVILWLEGPELLAQIHRALFGG